jgi:hypothetical protein
MPLNATWLHWFQPEIWLSPQMIGADYRSGHQTPLNSTL